MGWCLLCVPLVVSCSSSFYAFLTIASLCNTQTTRDINTTCMLSSPCTGMLLCSDNHSYAQQAPPQGSKHSVPGYLIDMPSACACVLVSKALHPPQVPRATH